MMGQFQLAFFFLNFERALLALKSKNELAGQVLPQPGSPCAYRTEV